MLFLDEDTAANQINLSIYKVLLACEFWVLEYLSIFRKVIYSVFCELEI